MFGVEARMPSEWELPSLRMAVNYDINHNDKLTQRLRELLRLTETREEGENRLERIQKQRKQRIDGNRDLMSFKVNDWVLRCKKMDKYKQGKLKLKWVGPYVVLEAHNNGTYFISRPEGEEKQLVNGNKLKMYYFRDGTYLELLNQVLDEGAEEDPLTQPSMGVRHIERIKGRHIKSKLAACIEIDYVQRTVTEVPLVIKEKDLAEILKRHQRRPQWPMSLSLLHIGFFEGKGMVKLARRLPKETKTITARLDEKALRIHSVQEGESGQSKNREQFKQQLVREWKDRARLSICQAGKGYYNYQKRNRREEIGPTIEADSKLVDIALTLSGKPWEERTIPTKMEEVNGKKLPPIKTRVDREEGSDREDDDGNPTAEAMADSHDGRTVRGHETTGAQGVPGGPGTDFIHKTELGKSQLQ